MFNVCYTLGWVVEVLARRSHPDLPHWLGPLIMALGLAFSLAVVTTPAAFWGGYRCLQIVGGTK